MPRFHVVLCDTNTGEIHGHVTSKFAEGVAILSHPWIAEVYTERWIQANIDAGTVEKIHGNLRELLAYSCLCTNLDSEIMKDLNAGDSSVFFNQQ